MTKWQGYDAWHRHKLVGTLIKKYADGITIDDARGIRHFINNHRIIGPVQEVSNDLFAPL